MNWFWVTLTTGTAALAGTTLCFYLLQITREVTPTFWFVEHIVCPIIRIVVLVIIVGQIYPAIASAQSDFSFWQALFQQHNINHIINVLFFGSLILSFLPIVSHSMFALPIQSCLTVALIFGWQYADIVEQGIEFIPGIAGLVKITLYMAVVYFITRELSFYLSRWIDSLLVISGSVRLVADAIYLILQIPVILLYCSFLNSQIPPL